MRAGRPRRAARQRRRGGAAADRPGRRARRRRDRGAASPGSGSAGCGRSSLALLATGVAAAVATDVRGSLLIVALPLAAVVLPGRRRRRRRRCRGPVAARTPSAASPDLVGERRPVGGRRPAWLPVAALGAVTAVAVAAWVPAARTLDDRPDGPDRQAVDGARDWVLANLPEPPEAGRRRRAVGLPGGGRLPRRPAGRRRRPRPGPAPLAGRLGRLPVRGGPRPRAARRGRRRGGQRGADALRPGGGVRRRRGPGRGAPGDDRRGRRSAGPAGRPNRVDAGVALARNPRLVLQPAAADLLRGGAVDARSMAVLAAITGEHSLSVADFPPVPGENARQPRRLIAVTAIDDRPVRAGAARRHAARPVAARPAAAVPARRDAAGPARRPARAAGPARRARRQRAAAALSAHRPPQQGPAPSDSALSLEDP